MAMRISNFLERKFKPGYWAYHRIRNAWPVWFYLLNRKPRRLWRRAPSHLSERETAIAREIRRDGIAVAHLNNFFPDGRFFEGLKARAFGLLEKPESQAAIREREANAPGDKDEIMVHLLGGYGASDRYALDLDDPFMRLGLNDGLLRIAAAYLGFMPRFKMYSLHSMILLSAGSPQLFSQRWHRDPDDKKLVKFFLYLTDVEAAGDGPFTYVLGSQLGGRWRHIFPQVPPLGSYPKPGAVEALVPGEDIKICTGKAGTLIFADTSGLHRGGHSTERRRLMFAGTYASAASLLRQHYYLTDSRRLSTLSPLQRHALEDSS